MIHPEYFKCGQIERNCMLRRQVPEKAVIFYNDANKFSIISALFYARYFFLTGRLRIKYVLVKNSSLLILRIIVVKFFKSLI